MSIIQRLASALDRRDETPNEELAKEIIARNDKSAVKELIEHLNGTNKAVQSDCIKVLYEIGAKEPKLIADYVETFISLLDSKNNRSQWGAMAALYSITQQQPKAMFQALPKIISVAEKGSIITNDHCVGILIKLASVKDYKNDAVDLLLERLQAAPTNQLPMYAENVLPIVNADNKLSFTKLLKARLNDVGKEAKRLRIEKTIKKIEAK